MKNNISSMTKALLILIAGFTVECFALEPEVTITLKNSYNGFGTIAGKVSSDSKELIGVSVENGGVRYSTVADPSGNWAVVFRHVSTSFTVKAWHEGTPPKEISITDSLPLQK